MSQSLIDRFGITALAGAVFHFYDQVLRSRLLAPHFENVGIQRLIAHQTQFLASVMGGPESTSDEELARIHLGLGIDDRGFEEMVGLLANNLRDLALSEDELAGVLAALSSRRHLIVAEPAGRVRSQPARSNLG